MAKFIVDDNNNGDFNTIAEAVAAAKDGDKIIVTGGDDNIQNEANIVIDKDLKIESDQDGATIDGGGAGRIFTIDDGDANNLLKVEIEELTLTGGNSADTGGAILNSEELEIKESTITGNTAQVRGGGIYNLDGELEIEKSIVSDNVAVEASGGGISSTGTLEVKNTTVENNTANAGGGIANSGTAEIDKSDVINNNVIEGVGGGIFNIEGQIEIENSNITGNSTNIAEGGGIANYLGQLEIKKSVISGNTAGSDNFDINAGYGDGGAILDDSGTTIIKDTVIDGNVAENDGGAIFAYNSTLILDKTIVSNNSAAYGAITSQISDITITRSGFDHNTGFIGGAITSLEDGNLSLDGNVFQNNTSTIGSDETVIFATAVFGLEDAEDLTGSPDDDFVNGFEGNDTIVGLAGNDVLIGGTEDDILTGGAGEDTFVFVAGQGTDTITDFIDGEDFISIFGGVSFDDIDLSGSEIGLNGETLAVLTGVDTSALTSDDFLL